MDNCKIIFLDIDGVLNSEDFAVWCATIDEGKAFIKEGGHHWVDPKTVKLVLDICENENTKIVLSSSWRYGDMESTIEYLQKYRDLQCLIPYIIGITPYSKSRERGQEIQYFLNYVRKRDFNISNRCFDTNFWKRETSYNISYCIIDDDNDMLESQMNNFVQTNWVTGLTENDCINIKRILNNEQ